jgi:hypothetical protein
MALSKSVALVIGQLACGHQQACNDKPLRCVFPGRQ